MKAGIPIIIASIIFAALIITTVFYVTAYQTFMYKVTPVSTGEYNQLREELASIIISALRTSSSQAYQTFTSTLWQNYQELWKEGERVRRLSGRYSIEVQIYNYANYSRDCGSDPNCVWSTDYSTYNLQGFNASRESYLMAVGKASSEASGVYRFTLIQLLDRWRDTRRQQGYLVDIVDYDAKLNISMRHVRAIGSFTTVNLTAYASAEVLSPISGFYKVNSSITLLINASYVVGWRDYNASYLPFNISAKVIINNVARDYLIDPASTTLILNTSAFTRMTPSLAGVENRAIKPDLVSMYYLGGSLTQVVFIAKLNTTAGKNVWTLILEIINGLSLSSGQYDDELPPPADAFPPSTIKGTVYRHVLVFFVAGLLKTNVEGVEIPVPTMLAFKYFFDTKPSGYDWVTVRILVFYGDPAIQPPS